MATGTVAPRAPLRSCKPSLAVPKLNSLEGNEFLAHVGMIPLREVSALKPHLPLLCRLPPTVLAVAVLAMLACLGAAMESPVSGDRAAAVGAAMPHVFDDAPAWQAASHPQAINVVSPNLQQPRAPRQRGERPTSGVDEIEAVMAAEILEALGDDTHRPFMAAVVCACPLAGHPLSLLRPPSLLVG